MHKLSLKELSAGLKARRFSSRELTQHYLGRIERHDRDLNSFITVTAERALAQADAADARLAAGEGGALTGIPLVQKDIFCTTGVRTSCGSKMLDRFIAPYDATIVRKLDSAGCARILVQKLPEGERWAAILDRLQRASGIDGADPLELGAG